MCIVLPSHQNPGAAGAACKHSPKIQLAFKNATWHFSYILYISQLFYCCGGGARSLCVWGGLLLVAKLCLGGRKILHQITSNFVCRNFHQNNGCLQKSRYNFLTTGSISWQTLVVGACSVGWVFSKTSASSTLPDKTFGTPCAPPNWMVWNVLHTSTKSNLLHAERQHLVFSSLYPELHSL